MKIQSKKIAAKLVAMLLTVCLLAGCGSSSGNQTVNVTTNETSQYEGVVHELQLMSAKSADGSYTHTATLDGATVEEFDYVWHSDPSEDHGVVKNAPAEYYTGTEPNTDAAIYIAHDVEYFPTLSEDGFKQIRYDDENEWAYYYTAEGYTDYVYGTLPVEGQTVPTNRMHSEEEAYENAVLHITEPGTYRISGEWHGQILVDLGDKDETFTDETAKVTLILNGVDVTCTVAPAMICYSAYECDNTWEDRSEYSVDIDTTNAGMNVFIADNTENTFEGTNVYRMLKTKFKDENNTGEGAAQKKIRKTDGAFYSYVTMNINGETQGTGKLYINSDFEGLDTELHLTINGGNIYIASDNDGINVNEDDVSVVAFRGGNVYIAAGLGQEGDGVDSNGYILVDGGNVVSIANPSMDSGLDASKGAVIRGGTVVATGSTMDMPEGEEGQLVLNMQVEQGKLSNDIRITDEQGKDVFTFSANDKFFGMIQDRTYSGLSISTPNFEQGKSYLVYLGGEQQGWTTQNISFGFAGFGGFSGFGPQMGNGDGEQPPTGNFANPPEGFDGTQMPPNGGNFQRPEGNQANFQKPSGERPSENRPSGERPNMPNFNGHGMPQQQQDSQQEQTATFVLSEVTNNFGGVSKLQ